MAIKDDDWYDEQHALQNKYESQQKQYEAELKINIEVIEKYKFLHGEIKETEEERAKVVNKKTYKSNKIDKAVEQNKDSNLSPDELQDKETEEWTQKTKEARDNTKKERDLSKKELDKYVELYGELDENKLNKKKKEPIKVTILMILVGITAFIVCFSVFIVSGRPFEHFVRVECTVKNVDFFMVDTYKAKVVYYVDDIKYEKIIDSTRNPIKIIFDYNKKDPTDIIVNRQSYIVGMPIMAGIGAIFSVFGVVILKKQRLELLKEDLQQ